jgi:predicted dehydrogenase
MEQQDNHRSSNEFNRRAFIQNATSFAALMTLMGGVPLYAEETNTPAGETHYSTASAPVNCAVIGCGVWGREILQTLSLLPNAPVVAVCDTYEAMLRRAKEAAPKAEAFTDYQKLLAKKEVQAVIVATPSHLHREIVEAALAAGKHVYCEAPFAASIEDAQAIAKVAKAAVKLNFQAGLQMRADPQRHFLLPFIRSGATGRNVMARSQWHKKTSWRRAAATPEREKALNWRLTAATSPGLIGEIAIHQLDMIQWLLNAKPSAISGHGSVLIWNDGRDVPDTVQAIFEFPQGVNYFCDCTLGNSFDSAYEVLYGEFSAVMMRESKAWLFKEVDSPMLGWEVYARKDQFGAETGIALVANASKLPPAPKPGQPAPPEVTALQHALAAFVTNCGVVESGVKDFTTNYGEDLDGLRDYMNGPTIAKARRPAATWQEGFEATVLALKANEAILKHERVAIQKELFEV